jgi:hypothetical protein
VGCYWVCSGAEAAECSALGEVRAAGSLSQTFLAFRWRHEAVAVAATAAFDRHLYVSPKSDGAKLLLRCHGLQYHNHVQWRRLDVHHISADVSDVRGHVHVV